MPKIKKTKSGNWQTKVYDYTDDNGKRIYKSITKQTKAEVELAAAQIKANKAARPKTADSMTVYQVVNKYINISEKTLSPSTISRYKKALRFAFPDLMPVQVNKLTLERIQKEINKETERPSAQTGKRIAPKTVRSEWSLIKSALKTVCNVTYSPKLPRPLKKIKTLPHPKTISDIVKGTEIELPCRLAFEMSLRMAEVRGLEYKNIKEGCVFIEQTKIVVDGLDVLRPYAKTSASIRQIPITANVQRLLEQNQAYINKNGFICDMSANTLHHAFLRLMNKNNIKMSFHDLRHVFATTQILILQQPIKAVQILGGWESMETLLNTYCNGMYEIVQDAAKKSSDFYASL